MGYYATTSEGMDLQEACRVSVRYMIDFLEGEHGLSCTDAYMLCSVAGDLKISVPVLGEGHAGLVAFYMPRSVFVG
jgi:acetamidase/formamidase